MKILIALLALGLTLGCSSKDKPTETPPAKSPSAKKADAPAKKAAAPAKKAATPAKKAATGDVSDDGKVVTVNMTGSDKMQFNLKQIDVAAGRTIKLNLKHTGTMPVAAMGHNFVLLKAGTDVAAFGGKAAASKATGYIPASEQGSIIASTKLVGGGESTSIEFPAPPAGTYDYICTFPGHYALMRGKLIVK